MKRTNTLVLFLLYWLRCVYSQPYSERHEIKTCLAFKENKGQVGDQFSKPRPDVLFSGNYGEITFYLRNKGISYQMYRVDKWKQTETTPSRERSHKVPSQTNIYRLDVEWLNANPNPTLIKENPLVGYDNYYTELCPNGVTGVLSYKNVCYQNLYKGIDLKWYEKDGNLKYDFMLAPEVDYRQIQMEIKGAETISINKKGELLIKTPMGILTEKAPYVTQNGRVLKASWAIDKTTVSFDIKDVNLTQALIIDPLIRFWGSYFGGNQYDGLYGSATDASGNIYVAGDTYSSNNIATTGAHQTVFGDLSSVLQGDAILVKFNSAGQRLWATYYGGEGEDYTNRCAVNLQGNFIAMVGTSTSSLSGAIATPSSHQAVYSGSVAVPAGYSYFRGDAFLAIFDASGIRQWATYYGGPQNEWGSGCAFDSSGNVYMTGSTSSTNSPIFSTTGCHQSNSGGAYDGFLAKFNSSGTRLWGTFYGGSGWDYVHFCAVDADGNVCITGNTGSKNNISSTGAFQTDLSGPYNNGDGLIAKFNSLGVRQWATYYGDWGEDRALNCTFDVGGNVYVAGLTTANGGAPTGGLATAGAHQTEYGGGVYDAYLLKLTPSGSRAWCSYFGGNGNEDGNYCAADPSGNIYLLGCTSSTNAISTPCARQINYSGGGADAYMAKFNSNGTLFWGTYYGGSGTEYYCTGSVDLSGNIFLIGLTSSTTGTAMASPGSFQSIYGGAEADGYLAKFDGCIPNSTNTTSAESLIICEGKSTELKTSALCSVAWYDVPTGGIPIGTSPVFTTPSLISNTTFYVSESSCGSSTLRTAIMVTVNPYPLISINIPITTLCSSSKVELTASGANSFTWYPQTFITCTNCSDPIVSPPQTTEYCVIGTNDQLCYSTICSTIEVHTSHGRSFSFPSAFTPNGDGTNERFCLLGWDECNEDFLIHIFNRWGEKVFESVDPNFCWDGTYQGKLLDTEVFVYSVSATYKDGTKTNKTGNITLIR